MKIPILEYHDLGDTSGPYSSFHKPYVLNPLRFQYHLEWLAHNGFQTISIDDLFRNNIPNKSVIITFDDGHISSYEHAFPLLRKFDFQATFFLAAHFVGQENYLTIEQIQEMQEAGMHFESHSLSHPYLLSLHYEDIAREVRESKIEIEKIVQKTVKHFCIPYGFYNKKLLKCIKAAGYASAVTEKLGYYTPDRRSFKVLPRFTVKANITDQNFINIMCQNRLNMLPLFLVECCLHSAKKILGFKGYMRLKAFIINTKSIIA